MAICRHQQLHRQEWEQYSCRAVHSFGVRLRLDLVVEADYIQQLWLATGSQEHVKAAARLVYENRFKSVTSATFC